MSELLATVESAPVFFFLIVFVVGAEVVGAAGNPPRIQTPRLEDVSTFVDAGMRSVNV